MASSDSLRSTKTIAKYKASLKQRRNVDLRKLPVVFKGVRWAIVENEFPYDRITQVHHMLVPLRIFMHEWMMTTAERKELNGIMDRLGRDRVYDSIMYNLPHNRTVPQLFHYHLFKFKDLTRF